MGKAILAKGYSKFHFKFGLYARIIRLLPIFVGLYYGITYFAIAVVISGFIIFFSELCVIDYKLNLSIKRQFKYFIWSNFMFLVMFVIHIFFVEHINLWLYSFLFVILQLALIKLTRHDSFRFIEENISLLLRNLKNRYFLC
jgi:O-antigen/teichoic acid export membrane protein